MATTANTNALTDMDTTALVVQPLVATTTALAEFDVFRSSETETRVPIVTEDPAGDWYEELAEIDSEDVVTREEIVQPRAVKAVVPISNELLRDTSGKAQTMIGQALTRALSARIDEAVFGAPTNPLAPDGLRALIKTSTVAVTGAWTTTDPFTEAISKAAEKGATITAFIVSPADALLLGQVKDAPASRRGLLTPDPTAPTRLQIAGVPLVTNRYVQPGVVWGVPRTALISVLRQAVDVEVSEHALFTRDAVAVRAVARYALAVAHEAAVVKITRS